jgi:glycosyltransferase involved in cell wall biosynthesis
MRVLYLSQWKVDAEYGGGQVYLRNLLRAMATQEIEAGALVVVNGQDERQEEMLFERVRVIQRGAGPAAPVDTAIEEEIRRFGADVVHAHGWKREAARVCKRLGVPCVVTMHHGGLVCPAGTRLNHRDEICRVAAGPRVCLPCVLKATPGWRLWWLALRCWPYRWRVAVGRAVQRLPMVLFLTPVGTASLSIDETLESIQELRNCVSCFVAPSPAAQETLMANGVERNRIRVLGHGIPLLRAAPLKDGLEERPLRFAFIGRISRIKGLHVLLAALRRLQSRRPYEVVIYGSAVTRPEKRYLAQLKRDGEGLPIQWCGQLAQSEVEEALHECDLMVHPAICLEIFGLTIAEAQSAGRPVIATRCGGAEFQIRDGIDGRLVAPNDAGALAKVIDEVLENPSLVDLWHRNVSKPRSIETHAGELLDLYAAVKSSTDFCHELNDS